MNKNKELLKSFVIGSSIISYIIILLVVIYLFKTKEAKFDYYRYTVLAPIGIGTLSLLAKYVSINYDVSLKKSYLFFSLLSSIFVSINISRDDGAYNFSSTQRWYIQYILIFVGHLFMYNGIIYPIDLYL
tara:strand:+ start:1275 stop:1664 length:390 start_codon:yes stop_codon:yes gene_type:complete